jgi:phosphoribosyl 1,2-cyclic phosphate phosphodiesterase
MQLTILGTAAAEGWPAPFCRCIACQEARSRKGPDIRTRAGAIIDNAIKIDFSADTVSQLQRTGRDLCNIHSLVFTHQHSDHIVPTELEWSREPFTMTPPKVPIKVYGNCVVTEMIRAEFPEPLEVNLDLQPDLQPFVEVELVDGTRILPLPADHCEHALLLRIRRPNGKTIFWGHDSGRLPAETVSALGNAGPVDIAVFDCTFGGQPSNNRGHLGVDGVIEMVSALRTLDVIVDATTVVATHFSHNGGLLHDELIRMFAPHGVNVAHDGVTYTV